jgi:tRNA(Ile)-lysidine synthetase-like protein
MEQSSCLEADSRPGTQEIIRLFQNEKIHYRARKNLPLATILIIAEFS